MSIRPRLRQDLMLMSETDDDPEVEAVIVNETTGEIKAGEIDMKVDIREEDL